MRSALPLVSTGAAAAAVAGGCTPICRRRLERIGSDEQAGAGELLGDLDFDELPDLAEWLRAQRQAWREQRDAALAAAADRCEKDGAIVRGLVYAQRLSTATRWPSTRSAA